MTVATRNAIASAKRSALICGVAFALKVVFVTPGRRQFAQAVHDLLYHGSDLTKYACVEPSGPYFSLFLPLLLASLLYTPHRVSQLFGSNKRHSYDSIVATVAAIWLLLYLKVMFKVKVRYGIRSMLLYAVFTVPHAWVKMKTVELSASMVYSMLLMLLLDCLLSRRYVLASALCQLTVTTVNFNYIVLCLPLVWNNWEKRGRIINWTVLICVAVLAVDCFVYSYYTEQLLTVDKPELHSHGRLLSEFQFQNALCAMCLVFVILYLTTVLRQRGGSPFITLGVATICVNASKLLSNLDGGTMEAMECLPHLAGLMTASLRERFRNATLMVAILLLLLSRDCFLLQYESRDSELVGQRALQSLHVLSSWQNSTDRVVRIAIDLYTAERGVSPFLFDNDMWRYEIGEIGPLQRYRRQFYHYILIGATQITQDMLDEYKETHALFVLIKSAQLPVVWFNVMGAPLTTGSQVAVLQRSYAF